MTLPPHEIRYRLTPARSRRCPKKHTLSTEPLGPPVPRIARLMALAIRLGDRIERENLDCRELARCGHVSRTRLTQILNLLSLAPDIQERLLFLAAAEKGRDAISEKQIRSLAAEYDWDRQRRAFERLLVR